MPSSTELSAKIIELIGLSSLCEPQTAQSFFLQHSGKWTSIPKRLRSLRPEERILEVEVKLQSPIEVRGIDVGNYWSAFLSVTGSRGLSPPTPLLSSKMLLSRLESARAENGEGVQFFRISRDQESKLIDRLQIKVSQPYNIPTDRFGLSMFVIRGVSAFSHKKEPITDICQTKKVLQNSADTLLAKAEKHIASNKSTMSLSKFLSLHNNNNDTGKPKVDNHIISRKPNMSKILSSQNDCNTNKNRPKPLLSTKENPKTPGISSLFGALSANKVGNISLSTTHLIRLARQVLKTSPLNSSVPQLLQRFHDKHPDLNLSRGDRERLSKEFQDRCSSPKRKRSPESPAESFYQKGIEGHYEYMSNKRVKANKADSSFYPSILRECSKEELRLNGVLVQSRVYKKDKELPLEDSGVIFVDAGTPIIFYKMGPDIYMEIKSTFYRPHVKPEYVVSVFKDYSEREILNSKDEGKENQEIQLPLIAIKDPAHLCPVCNEAEFFSVSELEAHCWSCTGPEDVKDIQALFSELNEPTPGPSGLQKIH